MKAAHPQTWSGTVYVQSIRSWNPKGFGGAIFAGCEVNERGELAQARRPIVVIAGHQVLRHLDPIEVGQFWHVSGPATEQQITAEHYQIRETAVRAEELAMVRESGQMIIHLLSRNRRFPGVGPVRARALWLRFGEALYDVLDRGDLDPVREVLNEKTARLLLEGWRQHASGRFVAFLAHHGFPPKLGSKVVSFFGADAEERLREDPYRLLSFSGNWREVDSLARSVFTVSRDDPRRLRGAVEEALYRLLAEKHTAATAAMVRREVQKLLQADRLVGAALHEARSSGAYVTSHEGRLYHAVGAYVMERRLAERACSLVRTRDPSPTLFLATLTDQRLGQLIEDFESAERKRLGRSFSLNDGQRRAVSLPVRNRLSIVTGGAGTGKTTVLRCLYWLLDRLGYGRIQMALSGRAAKRLQEVTGERAFTIAGFLKAHEALLRQVGPHVYLVVDEASMLDLPTAHRLLGVLPDSARVLLVGDPFQLPPIGPGLPFQTLAEAPSLVPRVELQAVLRQKDTTGIPAFAYEVRQRRWPERSVPGVRMLRCEDRDVIDHLLRLYRTRPEDTQILSALRDCPVSGVGAINRRCREAQNPAGRPILLPSDGCPTRYHEGDKILFTRNDWQRGVMNGSLGHITQVLREPVTTDEKTMVAKAIVDDVEQPIYAADLDRADPALEHGYAITVHKAQGSQFPRVLIPVRSRPSRVMDTTWFYTAVTRGMEEVMIVGNEEVARSTVNAGPRAQRRVTGLKDLLSKALSM